MTSSPRRILWGNTLFLVLTPLLSLVLVPLYVHRYGLYWEDLALTLALWISTGLGITVGYHRLFSHRGFKASWPVRLAAAICGGAAWQNSAIAWCSDHRRHHRYVDTDRDPYSIKKGFWFAHILWVMQEGPDDYNYDNVKDLWKDPITRWQHEHYLLITSSFNLGLPLAFGLMTGRVGGALLFGLLLRVVLVHHFTFAINSVAHWMGSRDWAESSSARDNWLLSLVTFGEGYHNFHHTFQYDYRNGPAWYNFDPSKWLIWTLERFGLTSELKRTPAEAMLRARFELQRRRLLERLQPDSEASPLSQWLESHARALGSHREALSEALQLQSSELRARADALHEGLRQQLLEAEVAVEERLLALREHHQAWVSARRQLWEQQSRELRREWRRETRQLRRALREAQRSTRAALRDFRLSSRRYTLAMS